ncbi:MAG: hypothetical protein NC084_10965 [Bacteroides sp.]|nr:hypothetical protein [Eubacterium sp.]MCM1419392.1 hypothetical protein [Roseburia sp.]MCM1463216.1 hypothetical protein [Bacteroides sp.]
MKAAFGKGTVRSRFYGFPIAGIGVAYLAAQLVLSLVFMLLAAIAPLWVEVILFVILLAAAGIGFISADTMRDEIEAQDRRLEENTSCITTLRSIVYPLARQCDGAEEKKRLEALSYEFRYSAPVSSPALEGIESELEREVAELQLAVSEVKTTEILPLCKKVGDTLVERNRLCKLSKGN